MGEGKDYVSRADEMGSINISEDVLAVIAAAAAMEVEGVGGMAAGLGTDVAELVGRKVLAKGVRLTMTDEKVAIDLSILVNYGSIISDVAKAVQDAVMSAVENTSGLTVSAVNVTVAGVMFPHAVKK